MVPLVLALFVSTPGVMGNNGIHSGAVVDVVCWCPRRA